MPGRDEGCGGTWASVAARASIPLAMGPASATRSSTPGVGGVSASSSAPPTNDSVMRRTLSPPRRATAACAASCSASVNASAAAVAMAAMV